MRLKRLKTENFKGRSVDLELPPKLAIVGRNFAGKSAVVDAIRWLLMGYVPEVGKLNSALWELSSGSYMEVVGMFENGHTEFKRRLEFSGGTIKASGSAPRDVSLIPGLNADYYFGLSDRERVNYVANAVPPPKGLETTTLIVELENMPVENDEEARARTILSATWDGLKQGHSLDEVLTHMREHFKQWNKREKDTIGAVRTLTELKLRQEATIFSVPELDEQITARENEMSELNELIGKKAEQRYNANRIVEERKQFESILYGEDKHAADVERYSKLIEEARAQLRPTLEPQERERSYDRIEQLKKNRDELIAEFGTAKSAVETLTKRLGDLETMTVCPFCQSDSEGWKANLSASLNRQREYSRKDMQDAEQQLDYVLKELGALNNTLGTDDAAQMNNRALMQNISMWERDIVRCSASSEKFKQEQVKAREALNASTETLKMEAPTQTDIELLFQKRTTLNQEILTLRDRRNALVRVQHDMKRAAESEQEHNHAVAMVKMLKEAARVIEARKAALVEIVFTELLKTANSLFGRILKSPLSFYQGDIGRWDGSKFIPHRVFSGTEKALCYTAISVALSAQSPMKLAIIDEFQRLDSDNQQEAITSLARAVDEKVLEQFVIVATDIDIERHAGVTCLQLCEPDSVPL